MNVNEKSNAVKVIPSQLLNDDPYQLNCYEWEFKIELQLSLQFAATIRSQASSTECNGF